MPGDDTSASLPAGGSHLDPVRILFDELRRMWRAAGEPTDGRIASEVGRSRTLVHYALRGPKVPRWPNLELIVEFLGGDPQQVLRLWEQARYVEDPDPWNRRFAAAGQEPPQPDYHSRLPQEVPAVEPVTLARLKETLTDLEVQWLEDSNSLLSMWERYAVLVNLEGPNEDILVLRTRLHALADPTQAAAAHVAVNEWNHIHRFMKAYVGDPFEGGLPLYGETQLSCQSGMHQTLLAEHLDCGLGVAGAYADWLHEDYRLFAADPLSGEATIERA